MLSRTKIILALRVAAATGILAFAGTFSTVRAQTLPGGGGGGCTSGGGQCCTCTITWIGESDFEITGCQAVSVNGYGSCQNGTRAGGGDCGGNCSI